MGLIKAFTGSLNGTFADQWKDIITAGDFDEYSVLSPGVFIEANNKHGTNTKSSTGIVTNGSKIYVPENTNAVLFNQGSIETVITEPGGYEYQDGEKAIFNSDSFSDSIIKQAKERFTYGGQPVAEKRILFVNLREIRGIKFGTKGPLTYHDLFYDSDLEIIAFGSFSIKVTDTSKLIRNLVPANRMQYSFSDVGTRKQLIPEFIQSFNTILNTLSKKYRVSELPSNSSKIANAMVEDKQCKIDWEERFGISIISIAIENIEFSKESRTLVKAFSTNKMNVMSYDNISQKSANISAQQKIALGIQENGLGEGAGMMLGMNMGQMFENNLQPKSSLSFDEQMDTVAKLKELLDSGILSEQEFTMKKKEIMGF
ncbi:SPFH domain-containing protein [Companilactobacillus mishanensis]|uniref:SPFH domain-containing protein n=1 Tax=Companilactobacillus mishanensis TaxID=2486008 RepID=A0A5P0ZI45_9LACO|nr:SPFH domain-containing protein [Companilactobacillus mishanensis]MQS52678.1 SPFH domain-containing protein [Companilactobacillus mishanensis]